MAQAEEIKNIRKQYFKSWASYQIPMRPTQPLSYQETENLASYYLGYYSEDGRLVRFIKFLRKPTPGGTVQLEHSKATTGILYLSAEKHGQAEYSVGSPLNFEQTSSHAVYYKGIVKPNDNTVKLELIQTDVFFVDDYTYWPNGNLKSRTMQKQTGEIQHKDYDESGTEIHN